MSKTEEIVRTDMVSTQMVPPSAVAKEIFDALCRGQKEVAINRTSGIKLKALDRPPNPIDRRMPAELREKMCFYLSGFVYTLQVPTHVSQRPRMVVYDSQGAVVARGDSDNLWVHNYG